MKTAMDDPISKQMAIDALAKEMPRLTTPDGSGQFDHEIQIADEAFVDCMTIISKLPVIDIPRWIPCSEGLPEDTVIVTVETKTFKHKYVCEAVWVPRWSKKAEYDNWEDCSEYNEDEDEYYVLEGWYERVHNWDEYSFVGIEDDVIAWMPLPEPYKEE